MVSEINSDSQSVKGTDSILTFKAVMCWFEAIEGYFRFLCLIPLCCYAPHSFCSVA